MAVTNMPLGVTAVMLPELDLDEQIALCGECGVTHYSLRPRVIAENHRDKPWSNWGNHRFDLTPRRLLAEAKTIGKKLTDAGLTPFGTLPTCTSSDTDDEIRLHLEGAAAVGAGRVRVAPANYPAGSFDYPATLQREIDRFGQIVGMARPLGLKIVMETHNRSLVTSPGLAWALCRPFAPADLGVIFDISNFNVEGGVEPNLAVAVLDQYIDHCHVGGSRVVYGSYDEYGFQKAGRTACPMTEANLNIPTWIMALRDAGRAVPLVIEDFTVNRSGAQRLRDSSAALRRLLDRL